MKWKLHLWQRLWKRLTLTNSFSKEGAMLMKEARESLLGLFIKESIHLNSFNLLNWNSSRLKITPAEQSHLGNGTQIVLCQQRKGDANAMAKVQTKIIKKRTRTRTTKCQVKDYIPQEASR